MVTRRGFLAASLAAPLAKAVHAQVAPAGRMLLAMHQNTSRGAGFRGSLEGWARAGIRHVELNDALLVDFLEGDTLSGARSLLGDLNLTPVSGATVLQDIWVPGPARSESLETWRLRCEQFAELGLEKVYAPSVTNRPMTAEDFAATPEAVREAAEIARQHGLTAMIEFTRTSTHLATLTSALEAIREAEHPSIRPMIDLFHFWSGLSKFEDLDLLEPGELAHAHFQDLLDAPRELTNNSYRLIPGDGISPLVRILRKLAEKEYSGALSVELFLPRLVNGDPYEVASEIRPKSEAVMREAEVL
jgi:sugar phosphate isomerase/epimerase